MGLQLGVRLQCNIACYLLLGTTHPWQAVVAGPALCRYLYRNVC